MVSKIVEKLWRRTIKTFMDILILAELQNKPLSGYDIIGLVHKRFNVLVSSCRGQRRGGARTDSLRDLAPQGLQRWTHGRRRDPRLGL